jgi:hypothetical protein
MHGIDAEVGVVGDILVGKLHDWGLAYYAQKLQQVS